MFKIRSEVENFDETAKEFIFDTLSSTELNKHVVYSEIKNLQYPSAAQFYIAMLSISLIVGLSYYGYIIYNRFKNKTTVLYSIFLLTALLCRTFFSLLIASIVIYGVSDDVPGSNTLLAFECISHNLVLGFWLILTIYLHACVRANFNSEPSLKLYEYGIPSVGVFFALTWIFVLTNECNDLMWINVLQKNSAYQWIVNTIRLLYLFIQLGLVLDITRLIMSQKCTVYKDSSEQVRKCGIIMAVLIFYFWLQFGFSVGRPIEYNIEVYLFFNYLVEGLQCAVVCSLLYFFEKWGKTFFYKTSTTSSKKNENDKKTIEREEVLINNSINRSIFTIDSVYGGVKNERRNTGTEDIVYSSIVQPDNLKKTFNLYKRFNIFSIDDINLQNDSKNRD